MAARTVAARKLLAADARNRALRSALQAAAAATFVAVATVAVSVAAGAAFSWQALAGALATGALMPLAAAVHRLYVDPSGLPSATPPTDTTEGIRRTRRRHPAAQ